MNPRISIHHGVWPPIEDVAPPSTILIEDVTDVPGESQCTGEVVIDTVGSIHESQQTDRGYGSSRDQRRITLNREGGQGSQNKYLGNWIESHTFPLFVVHWETSLG